MWLVDTSAWSRWLTSGCCCKEIRGEVVAHVDVEAKVKPYSRDLDAVYDAPGDNLETFRHVCSEVIESSLFVSGRGIAADIDTLQRQGITHIVNAAADACTNHFAGQFQYLTYYLKDSNIEDISFVFYKTMAWIHDAIMSGGRVLVHCCEGISRSPTLCMSYVIWRDKLSFDDAFERIREVRPICQPNPNFTCQLLVLVKKLTHTGSLAWTGDRPLFYRVAPYHAREPFLLLKETQVIPSASIPDSVLQAIDPRFGWVVMHGSEATLWIGAEVADAGHTKVAVEEHLGWLLRFEKRAITLSVVQDRSEPPQFWEFFGLNSAPLERGNFISHNCSYDEDATITVQGRREGICKEAVEDVVLDIPRSNFSFTSSESSGSSSPSIANLTHAQMPPDVSNGPKVVPGLNLGQLGLSK